MSSDFRLEDAEIVKEAASGKAVLVQSSNLDTDVWVPCSVISEDSEVWRINDAGTLLVGEWWARKQGWC